MIKNTVIITLTVFLTLSAISTITYIASYQSDCTKAYRQLKAQGLSDEDARKIVELEKLL